jgi:hypothetical protein
MEIRECTDTDPDVICETVNDAAEDYKGYRDWAVIGWVTAPIRFPL